MNEQAPRALTLSVRLDDADLAERVAEALAAVPGLILVAEDEAADLVLGSDPGGGPGASGTLTPREHEVIGLLAEGLSNKRIAQRLGIAPDTAKFHVGRLLDKLDATGRTDAVAQAARLGIIEL